MFLLDGSVQIIIILFYFCRVIIRLNEDFQCSPLSTKEKRPSVWNDWLIFEVPVSLALNRHVLLYCVCSLEPDRWS